MPRGWSDVIQKHINPQSTKDTDFSQSAEPF